MATMIRMISLLVLFTACCVAYDDLCVPDIDDDPYNTDPVAVGVLVYIQHWYESNTNGRKYVNKRREDSVKMGLAGDSAVLQYRDEKTREHHLVLAFNGTHVCAGVDYFGQNEACAGIGCSEFDPDFECRKVCFPAVGAGSYNLDLYKSAKTSSGIGTWIVHDYVVLAVKKDVQLRCYGKDGPTYNPSDLPIVTCPVGKRCRVTTAKVRHSSNFRYYVGCEDNDTHLNGCDPQGCQINVRKAIGNGYLKHKWFMVCTKCCDTDLCNDPHNTIQN